jgi:aspartate/methionine/tyrosine aminotransferase
MSSNREVDVAVDLSVRRLIARYCQLVDDADFAAAAELWTEDGRFQAFDDDLRGRQAITEWLGRLSGTMWHNVTNVVVSNGSADGVYHAVSDLAFMVQGPEGAWAVAVVARYHDTLTGSGRDTRFSQRILKAR